MLQQIGTADYINVSRGLINGASRVQKNGFNPAVGSAFTTVWNETVSVVYPATADVITISSGSTNDTAAGTGARTVLVSGLDAAFFPISETLTLNGQTAVTSTKSYFRINTLAVQTAGSGGVNAGIIYAGTGSVSTGKPGTIYNSIGTGFNISFSAFYTVPANSTAYLVRHSWSTDQQASLSGGSIAVTVELLSKTPTGVLTTNRINVGTFYDVHYSLPRPYAAGTDIEMRAKSASATILGVEFALLLVNPS